MATYALSPIYEPQYVANSATALSFAPPGATTVVPANTNYQIAVMRVANNSGSPVTLKMWRVPSGSSADDAHVAVPTITIPVATQTFPYFDVTALWGVILRPGDSIVAIAGTASTLVIHADGAVVTP